MNYILDGHEVVECADKEKFEQADTTNEDKLRAFARDILADWPSLPKWIENSAVRCELLVSCEIHPPCGEKCSCEVYEDGPTTCYRPTPLLTGKN